MNKIKGNFTWKRHPSPHELKLHPYWTDKLTLVEYLIERKPMSLLVLMLFLAQCFHNLCNENKCEVRHLLKKKKKIQSTFQTGKTKTKNCSKFCKLTKKTRAK